MNLIKRSVNKLKAVTNSVCVICIVGWTYLVVSGYYYFFYDWEIQEPNCVSARTPVEVAVLPISDPTIDPDGPFCEFDAPITLNAASSGGSWSGPGVPGSTFDPAVAGIGNHLISHTIGGLCGGTDTTTIVVQASFDPTIDPAGPVCEDDTPLISSHAYSTISCIFSMLRGSVPLPFLFCTFNTSLFTIYSLLTFLIIT